MCMYVCRILLHKCRVSSRLLNLSNGKDEVNCFSHGKFEITGRGIIVVISGYRFAHLLLHSDYDLYSFYILPHFLTG